MSGPTLEQERQAILDRMHARRENYRRMLQDGSELGQMTPVSHLTPGHGPVTDHAHSFAVAPAYQSPAIAMQAGAVLRVLREHPLVCALAVAAVVAVGPKRLMRAVATSGTTLTALTARNQSNVDLMGRLLTMAGAYVQGRSKNPPH